MSKRKGKSELPPPPPETPSDVAMPDAQREPSSPDTERPADLDATGEHAVANVDAVNVDTASLDPDTTLDLRGEDLAGVAQARDDLDVPAETQTLSDGETADSALSRAHLMGLLEALVFASDRPIKTNELAKAASATTKETKSLMAELKSDYASRGVQLDEVAGGWIFRTNPQYAPFVRDLTRHKPVRLTRAQVETLAIMAYRQPITRPEIDDIRGVDCGATLKLLLERDLVKILGKKDEPGRPLLYGTTTTFLEFFGLKSLKDLPTLREFTELNEDSRRVVERELGDVLDARQPEDAASEVPPPDPTDPRIAVAPSAFEDGEEAPTDPPDTGKSESSVQPPEGWDKKD